MTLMLTDIRCGCGGLCDAGESCPMRGNAEACGCGHTAIIHTRGQQGCPYFGDYDWFQDPLGCNGPAEPEGAAAPMPMACPFCGTPLDQDCPHRLTAERLAEWRRETPA